MVGLDGLEIFLYVFPILEIILIHYFFRPYLRYGDKIKLSITDVTLPFLMIGMHIISVRLLTYSLLPHFIFVSSVVGLLVTFIFERAKNSWTIGKVFSFFTKIIFLIGFVAYYVLVGIRVYYLLRG